MSELLHPWSIEDACFEKGYTAVCGVDEAGAGPLAGDLYGAAVILPAGLVIEGLNDSKKLSEKKRNALYEQIIEQAEAYCVATASVAEIDELNILNARMLVMERAINGLSKKADFALIDGNKNRGITCPNEMVIGGDGKSASIAAASILAKVVRDRYVVEELHNQYPVYNFAKHKGYGTKLHYQMLDVYGPCPAHRTTFLKKWQARKP